MFVAVRYMPGARPRRVTACHPTGFDMGNFIQVMTTTATPEDAERIAQALVGRRLAACVQIVGPIRSIYHWQGNVEAGQEWLCLVKSRQDLYPQIEAAIRGLHPYEVPEILALPVTAGSASYLAWLEQETQPPGD
jgi:periplasmic divalent cation tolerance protein